MAVNCGVCGQSMTVAEVTRLRSETSLPGTTGNWHTLCAYALYLEDTAIPALKPVFTAHKNEVIARQTSYWAKPTTAPTLATAVSTNMGIGVYKYVVTFGSADGESLPGPSGSLTTTSGNQGGALTAIPTGPTGTTKRNIYRTAVGGSSYTLLHTIADNTTLTYSDTATDASIASAAKPPVHPTFKATE